MTTKTNPSSEKTIDPNDDLEGEDETLGGPRLKTTKRKRQLLSYKHLLLSYQRQNHNRRPRKSQHHSLLLRLRLHQHHS